MKLKVLSKSLKTTYQKKMKTNEEYLNLIELLKQALEFYGNTENYKGYYNGKEVESALVGVDNGTQARFALEKIKTFQDDRDEQEKEFVKNMINAIEADESQDNIMGLIEAYKQQTEND